MAFSLGRNLISRNPLPRWKFVIVLLSHPSLGSMHFETGIWRNILWAWPHYTVIKLAEIYRYVWIKKVIPLKSSWQRKKKYSIPSTHHFTRLNDHETTRAGHASFLRPAWRRLVAESAKRARASFLAAFLTAKKTARNGLLNHRAKQRGLQRCRRVRR